MVSNPGFGRMFPGLFRRHAQVCVDMSQLGLVPVQFASLVHPTHVLFRQTGVDPLQLTTHAPSLPLLQL
jgi:hypothetical protein